MGVSTLASDTVRLFANKVRHCPAQVLKKKIVYNSGDRDEQEKKTDDLFAADA